MEYINQFGAQIVHIVSNVTGLASERAQVLCLIIVAYLIVLIALIIVQKQLRARLRTRLIDLTRLYDTLRYQVAKAQYASPNMKQAPGVSALLSEKNPDYLHHTDSIHEEIQKIEQEIGSKIISDEQRNQLLTQQKIYLRKRGVSKFFYWITCILTAFLYALA